MTYLLAESAVENLIVATPFSGTTSFTLPPQLLVRYCSLFFILALSQFCGKLLINKSVECPAKFCYKNIKYIHYIC